MLVSFLISFTCAFFIRNHGIGIHKGSEEARIEKLYKECLYTLEGELREYDLRNKEELQKWLDNKYGYVVGYSFYIVNEDGKVIVSTDKGVTSIAKIEIEDGKRNYGICSNDSNIFRMTGCDYLKDSYYLYYSYLKYDENDTGMIAVALIGALFCFFVLIWRRISYISEIRLAVGQIAKGDLSYRVPVKYKNELRELADGINQMALSLENEEQKKNEFLTNISHDIRTPLTTILGYLEMIKREKYESKEELEQYMAIMERKGIFLSSMLEDFFQYSKLSSGDIKLEVSEFELNELLRQFLEEEEENFKKRKLSLKLKLFKEPIICMGDIQLLIRVVSNLLSNALKYSKPETIVTIRSELKKEDSISYGVFSVSNVPIEEVSDEELERLFDRLYKRDLSRSGQGSGLGLSITKNIVRLHGGKISVHTDQGQLRFTVCLKQ